MNATYNADAKTKWTRSHRKEGKCYFESYQIVTIDPKAARPEWRAKVSVELRLYGTGNVNTACLWVWAEKVNTQGSGRAGGYGYHRPSQAAKEAIENAGFTLSQDIGGVGDSAITEALCAIADSLGLENWGLVKSHA